MGGDQGSNESEHDRRLPVAGTGDVRIILYRSHKVKLNIVAYAGKQQKASNGEAW